MADEKNLTQAKAAFKALCDAMDAMDWKYKKIDEFTIETGAKGEDLPIKIAIRLDEKRSLIKLISLPGFNVPEDKRIDMALAVTMANYGMVHGCFDYNILDGRIYFRMITSYADMQLDEEVFRYLLLCACQTVDDYNDKFLMLSKGMLSVEDFLKAENN